MSLVPAAFSLQRFFEELQTTSLGLTVLYSPVVDSTQNLLQHEFAGIKGLTCITDAQDKGRGRSSNVWESPLGSLCTSFKLSVKVGRTLPFLQYLVCIALVRAMRSFPLHPVCHFQPLSQHPSSPISRCVVCACVCVCPWRACTGKESQH